MLQALETLKFLYWSSECFSIYQVILATIIMVKFYHDYRRSLHDMHYG